MLRGRASNLPNLLTWSRIVLIPALVVVFYLPYSWAPIASSLVFSVAAITDWADGYLARRLGVTSRFGAFLDPVADKLMVAVALILLVQADPSIWMALPAVVIISREITISALREWMAELGKRTQVRVQFIGKVRTGTQMAAIILLLWRSPLFGLPVREIGMVALYVAVALTLLSMAIYLRAAWPVLRSEC